MLKVRHKLMPYALAGLLAVAAVAAFAGPVEAQSTNAQSTVQIAITPLDTPIKPLGEPQVLTATVKYSYMSAGASALVPSKVTLKAAEVPPWAAVTISPSTLFFTIKQPSTPQTSVDADPQTAKIIISTTADAPAFTPGVLKITATADKNDPIAASSAEDSTPITADFFSIIDAQVQQPIRVIGPQKAVDFPVTVTNFGNANTKINFEVLDKSGGLEVPLPQPVTLEAKQTGGTKNSQTVAFSVQTPFRNGYMNQPGIVNLKMKGQYALDSSKKGEEVTLSVLVTTKGFYVPGPDALLLLAGVSIAAGLVAANRRDIVRK